MKTQKITVKRPKTPKRISIKKSTNTQNKKGCGC